MSYYMIPCCCGPAGPVWLPCNDCAVFTDEFPTNPLPTTINVTIGGFTLNSGKGPSFNPFVFPGSSFVLHKISPLYFNVNINKWIDDIGWEYLGPFWPDMVSPDGCPWGPTQYNLSLSPPILSFKYTCAYIPATQSIEHNILFAYTPTFLQPAVPLCVPVPGATIPLFYWRKKVALHCVNNATEIGTGWELVGTAPGVCGDPGVGTFCISNAPTMIVSV